MILEQTNTTTNNTNLASTTFSINESPIFFQVLSQSLYQYKERAVLRELAANAWDSHVVASCTDTPIRVQLPTALEPELVITDCGIGMSKEDLETYYFSYFSSSKRHSNDLIGAFGLGCKTPFIFSETYTVTTTKDGITTVALALLDTGIPKAMYLSSTQTNEPNGTSITIPVSDASVQANLQKEAITLFNAWPTKPIITKGSSHSFTIPIITPNLINDFVKITLEGYSYLEQFKIRTISIGLFEYEISPAIYHALESKYHYELASINSKFKGIYGSSLAYLTFISAPGELVLSPSREVIENTPKNIDILFNYISRTVETITKEIDDNIENYYDDIYEFYSNMPTTYTEYAKAKKIFYTKYPESLSSTLNSYFRNVTSPITHNINVKFKLAQFIVFFPDDANFISNYVKNIPAYGLNHNKNRVYTSIRYNGYLNIPAASLLGTFEELDNLYIVNATATKIARWINYNTSTLYTLPDNTVIDLTSVIFIKDADAFAAVCKLLEGYHTVLDENLFTVPKADKTTNSTKTIADLTVVFEELYNSSDTVYSTKNISAKEFYSTNIPDDTYTIIINGEDIQDSWVEFVSKTLIGNKVIVFKKLHQPELKSKRFEKYSASKSTKHMVTSHHFNPNHLTDEYTKAITEAYQSHISLLEKVYKISNLVNLCYNYKHSTGSSINVKSLLADPSIRLANKLISKTERATLINLLKRHHIVISNLLIDQLFSTYSYQFESLFPGIVYLKPKWNAHINNSIINMWKHSNNNQRLWLLQNSTILATMQTILSQSS